MSVALLKDQIDQTLVQQIASQCQRLHPDFTTNNFIQQVLDEQFNTLSLKQRIRHVATCLYQQLNLPFADACQVLMPLGSQFKGLPGFIFPDIIEQFGLDDVSTAMQALAHFTQFSTAEFAIRPFIIQAPAQTLAQMRLWAQSDNYHLRRLASEGCRPRLPWGQALQAFKQDPTPLLPILELLKADPSDYVRRSVANNLNDISKDHPDLVLNLAKRWAKQNPHTDWIIKHALRSLLKQRHPAALALFGYQALAIESTLQINQTQIHYGDWLEFTVQLQVPAHAGKIRLEYAIDFASSNGKLRHKVFQLAERDFAEGPAQLQRRYQFKDLTTRKHYAGAHQLHLIINGQISQSSTFTLIRLITS